MKDASHIMANIAVPSTIALVAQTRKKLLQSAQAYADISQHQQTAEAIRRTTAGLKVAKRLLQRVNQLREIVAWADERQRALGEADLGDTARQRVDEALALAHQV